MTYTCKPKLNFQFHSLILPVAPMSPCRQSCRKTGVKGSLNIGTTVGGNKLCSYILQEDNLHPFFTVQEIMTMACDLKISSRCLKHNDKQRLVSVLSIVSTVASKMSYLTHNGVSAGMSSRLPGITLLFNLERSHLEKKIDNHFNVSK